MIALVDGDIVAYTIAAGCEEYDDKTALSKCSEKADKTQSEVR